MGSYCCSFYLAASSLPSDPWVLSLAPILWSLCSVQWLAESTHLCICQVLAEPLRRQLNQASVSKHLLASTIVSVYGILVTIYGMEPQVGQSLDGLSFSLCSTLCLSSLMGILFHLLRRTYVSILWFFIFLSLICL